MPYSKYFIHGSTMESLADAVRNLTGKSSAFTPAQMMSEVDNYEYEFKSVSAYAHYLDSSITTFEDLSADFIGFYAFKGCVNLSSINIPNCKMIETGGIENCSELTTVSFPNCEHINNWAFARCKKLLIAYLPKCKGITSGTFYNCSSLTNINLSNCEAIGSNAFYTCFGLTTLSFPKCKYIGSLAFYGCSRLMSLYLNSVSSVTYLENINAFTVSPLDTEGNGTIYVPLSLVTAFKNANNWSMVKDKIVGI